MQSVVDCTEHSSRFLVNQKVFYFWGDCFATDQPFSLEAFADLVSFHIIVLLIDN